MFRCSILIVVAASLAAAPTTSETGDAAELYRRAGELVEAKKVYSPAESDLEYPTCPPFGSEWDAMAKAAYEANSLMRELVHRPRERNITEADWGENFSLNTCRALANEMGDAALYEHLQGNHATAIEDLRDVLFMSDLLQANPKKQDFVQSLVGIGIDALVCDRLMIIASDVGLTNDPKNTRDLQASIARVLIKELLDHPDAKQQIAEIMGPEGPTWQNDTVRKLIDAFRRIVIERRMAAVSLAAHVYRFEKGDWPKTIEQLVPKYLPSAPIDPWGFENQPLGYVIIEHGLPNGDDRPLVYSRCWSENGLAYRIDQPQFSFYFMDGTNRPSNQMPHLGQFRDIARWSPPPGQKLKETTRPLP